VVEFLKKNEAASSWAVKILADILNETDVNTIVLDELRRLGAEYTRDPEKKEVLLHFFEGKQHDGIAEASITMLKDMSDDVKMAALRTLGTLKDAKAREPILELLTNDETAKRVQTRCIEVLHEAKLEVQGFREKVEKRLPEPFFIDKSGIVKKRG
jgi:HEAT repeat protein